MGYPSYKKIGGIKLSELVEKLSSDDWIDTAISLRDKLKIEIQGTTGFWKVLREKRDESELKQGVKKLIQNFAVKCDEANVDASANTLANEIWQLNQLFTSKLAWDIGQYLANAEDDLIVDKSNISAIRDILLDAKTPEIVKMRLVGICQHLIFSSISQGNKSNAGSAGESLVEAIFTSVGAVRGEHYRTQYKSSAGSDTDFVIPAIEDFNDSKIEVLIAVQFSTNDRARLVSSELKTGGIKYMFSGNGLDASSKKLNDIGDQIIQSLMKDNVKIVCYGPGLKEEILRLQNKIDEAKKSGSEANSISDRLKYFSNYAISYTEFRSTIKRWCNT